jgi:hypothetical protein
VPPNHHHRRGVESAILEEEESAIFAELRVGFVAEDQVLVDAERAGAVGDGVVVARGRTRRAFGTRFPENARTSTGAKQRFTEVAQSKNQIQTVFAPGESFSAVNSSVDDFATIQSSHLRMNVSAEYLVPLNPISHSTIIANFFLHAIDLAFCFGYFRL